MKIFVLIRQDFFPFFPMVYPFDFVADWIQRSIHLWKKQYWISMRKFEILSPFFLFLCYFSFHRRTPVVSVNRGDVWRSKKWKLEAVFFFCLSRLYFALNRIQGSLQIDKKKKKGGKQAFWNVRKVETIRVQKKDKMKRKHSSGVRKM